ncbi:hypothetical protein [Sphingomonas endophytica]|uniref:Uncharacterized protein n=1 Tax=Sphingomonas endophytica TaxID=869719 RepID=A0A147I9K0_9SPHN|nr:hypothetical protein [Sphingomonas endophytica]KTT76247.1 hypothetical protein NS334_01375 [Sphingomonas endophytica]
MLAGLLFATHEADDRSGMLAATLPFAAATLIEYQARLLLACDAAQIVVVVSRLTPELIGALARIGRRGVAVDTVRSAADALAKLHPLARVVMIADGLVTTEGVVSALAGEPGDALLVVPGAQASPLFERVGGGAAWAGVARIEPGRLADAARLPEDYDLQSTLVHTAEQAGARHVALRLDGMEMGHGIERRAVALEERGRAVLSASMALRPSWFERLVLRPLARTAIPWIARRGIGTEACSAGAGAAMLAGLATIWFGATGAGLALVLLGVLAAELAGALALFRDEPALLRANRVAILVAPALAILLLAQVVDAQAATTSARLLALSAVLAGGVGERAASATGRRPWWGVAPAYLALLTPFALLGYPTVGIAAVGLYAAATVIAAVERLRQT